VNSFKANADRLAQSLDAAQLALAAIDERAAAEPWAPGKWSRKDVLGHLIDSAANNHQRFVRAQQPGDLHFPPYVQDHWVGVQHYQERTWRDLVELWSAYNRHLAHILAFIPDSLQGKACTIGAEPTVTLGYLAEDYIDHLWHHLNQIGITR